MKKLKSYFKPYKWQSLLGPLFKLFEATFELLVPFVVGLIVDRGLGAYKNGGYPNADKSFIVWASLILVGFGLLGFFFSVIAQYFSAKTAVGVASDLRSDLFKKIQSLSYIDIDKTGTATLLTRMTGDINTYQSGVNLALRLFLRSPFIVFGAMITACIIDPASFGVFALAIVLLAIVVYAVMFICMPLYKKSQGDLDEVLLSTRENLSGVRVIRAFCLEESEKQKFANRNEKLTKGRKFVGAISAITNPLTSVLVNGAIILLLYTGGLRVNSGTLTQGQLIALYNLMGQILVELIKLANLIVTVTKALSCGARIRAVLNTDSSLILTDTPKKSEDTAFIRFDNVTAQYGESEPALEDISFTVQKGETVGIIGGTGSGKSTLVNLIPHFYDTKKGEVYLNGESVKSRALQPYLREKIGVVPQKAVLFKGTLRENLAWGKADATDEEMITALKIAQAEDFVFQKQGLDTPVERGGKNFSGGQRQRLTIARAVTRNPEILILDDSSSALDYATDSALRKALKELKTTTFIVSQRASSVMHADKIIVLDDGKAVGIGDHESLLKDCEVYREIYLSQFEEGGGVK